MNYVLHKKYGENSDSNLVFYLYLTNEIFHMNINRVLYKEILNPVKDIVRKNPLKYFETLKKFVEKNDYNYLADLFNHIKEDKPSIKRIIGIFDQINNLHNWKKNSFKNEMDNFKDFLYENNIRKILCASDSNELMREKIIFESTDNRY